MNLETKVEAILFYKNEPVKLFFLAEYLKVSMEELSTAITSLRESLESRGIVLLENAGSVQLATNPELGEMLEELAKEELNKNLGNAGLETLAMVLYKGPISRSQIDRVRGVNSSFILRALMTRGLIERTGTKEGRGYLYQPSFKLLEYLGVTSVADLPDYAAIETELKQAEENLTEEEQNADA